MPPSRPFNHLPSASFISILAPFLYAFKPCLPLATPSPQPLPPYTSPISKINKKHTSTGSKALIYAFDKLLLCFCYAFDMLLLYARRRDAPPHPTPCETPSVLFLMPFRFPKSCPQRIMHSATYTIAFGKLQSSKIPLSHNGNRTDTWHNSRCRAPDAKTSGKNARNRTMIL